MTARTDIAQRVRELIAEQLFIAVETVKDESRFIEDLGGDSLDRVTLVMAIEEEFEIEISDEDGEKLLTVKQAIDYVTGRVRR